MTKTILDHVVIDMRTSYIRRPAAPTKPMSRASLEERVLEQGKTIAFLIEQNGRAVELIRDLYLRDNRPLPPCLGGKA